MISFYLPSLEELSFRQKMLSDEATMSYNHAWGGTVPFPKEDWEGWYERWITNGGKDRFYRYIKNDKEEFVGEAAYHMDETLLGHIVNVIIYSPYRKMGYGSAALDLLCLFAKERGLSVLYDDIASDNPAKEIFLRHGFVVERITKEKIILRKDL